MDAGIRAIYFLGGRTWVWGPRMAWHARRASVCICRPLLLCTALFCGCHAGCLRWVVFVRGQLVAEKGEMERRRTLAPGAVVEAASGTERRPSLSPPTGDMAQKGWKLLSGNQVVFSPVACRHLTPAKYHGFTHPYVVCSLEKQSQVGAAGYA